MGLLVRSTQRAGYVFTWALARDLLHPTAEEERKAQAEAFGSTPQQLFYGCQVPRLLQDHHCLFTCPDSCCLCRMCSCSLPANWRPCSFDGRMLVPQEATLRCIIGLLAVMVSSH